MSCWHALSWPVLVRKHFGLRSLDPYLKLLGLGQQRATYQNQRSSQDRHTLAGGTDLLLLLLLEVPAESLGLATWTHQ